MFQKLKVLFVLIAFFGATFNLSAEPKRVFTEDEFIKIFSGKPKSRITKYLGDPDSSDIAIKPKGVSSVIGIPAKEKKSSKKDKIEMWYYSDIVEYTTKKTYMKVELTLVNDRCVNIAFFNQ